MRYLWIGITTAMAVISAARAQTPPPGTYQLQWPPAPSNPYSYPLAAPTPRDAYREGLINRWQFEQLEGPLPPALQGPSPDGRRGGGGGGS
jgi:hypothetical protein